jgi:fumarate hydratase subunit beta
MELKTPLTKLNSLKIGDVVYLTGTIFTARDQACKRILEQGAPFKAENQVIYHCGPLVKGKVLSAGPTTSRRMEEYMPKIIELGVKAIIGKGGLRPESVRGAVYFAFPGGCGALAAKAIKKISNIYWPELGPEAIYEFEVERFGPLIIGIDLKGNSLYLRS